MITMEFSQAEVGVGTRQTGSDAIRILQVTDKQAGITVVIPLTVDGARTIGAALQTSLLVPNSQTRVAQ